jgi:hypothetical protein
MTIRDLFNDIACDVALDRKTNRRFASWKDFLTSLFGTPVLLFNNISSFPILLL